MKECGSDCASAELPTGELYVWYRLERTRLRWIASRSDGRLFAGRVNALLRSEKESSLGVEKFQGLCHNKGEWMLVSD